MVGCEIGENDASVQGVPMTDPAIHDARQGLGVPPDDPGRKLALVQADDPKMGFVSVAGDTYTILLTAGDTGGRYCLIDMHVPPGGGPPPHRHDFEEMFTLLEGEIELTFRGQTQKAGAGFTVNIPANAPHGFKNQSNRPARLLCMYTPPGLEEFFLAVGIPVASRTAPAPDSNEEQRAGFLKKAMELAPKYRIELLGP